MNEFELTVPDLYNFFLKFLYRSFSIVLIYLFLFD